MKCLTNLKNIKLFVSIYIFIIKLKILKNILFLIKCIFKESNVYNALELLLFFHFIICLYHHEIILLLWNI